MKGLDATQTEQLRQIAEYLSYQREHQNSSLEKISNETYIPLRVLRAIDSLQLDQLPEPVYIKGFIRRYADALGLNGIEIADAFPIEPATPAVPEADGLDGTNLAPQSSSYQSGRSMEREVQPRFSGRSLLLAGIGAAVAVGAIALGAFYFFNRSPASSPEVVNSPETTLPSESATAPTSPGSSTPASPDAPPSPAPKAQSPSPGKTSSPVQADVSLTGRSWVQVVADGKTAYEGTLGQGEQRTWQAQKKLVVTAGNAGAVVFSCNQGQAKPLGKAGEVVDATCLTSSANTGQVETR
jgi:cytoskeleton protein RodZ